MAVIVAAVLDRLVSSRWGRILWDLVIATVVATIAVQYRSASVQDVLIGLGMAAAVVFRRAVPVRVFAVVSSLALLQLFVCPSVPAGYDLALLVAMVAVVIHARHALGTYAALAVVVAGVVTLAVQDIVNGPGPVPDYTVLGEYSTLLVACAALWLLAYVLRVNRERNVVLADLLATAERERDHLARLAAADERAFIARELHDIVAHSLAVMVAQADGASYAIGTDTVQAQKAMRIVAGTGRDALEDMHRLVGLLRAPGSAADEPAERRRRGIDQLEALVSRARTAGVHVDLHVAVKPVELSPSTELTVYRLVQEALTNVLRHAGPGVTVEVALQLIARQAVLEISDDGSAPSTGQPVGGGNGLVGMRERVAVHGGQFAAGPRPGGGWQIRACIPAKGAA